MSRRSSRRPRKYLASGEGSLRALIAAKGDVEYGAALLTDSKAEPLVRRARSLVELATQVVRLGS